jgi:DNA polymerase-3 subunit alpha
VNNDRSRRLVPLGRAERSRDVARLLSWRLANLGREPMSDQPFVHLHCHTHYSLLDGAAQPKDLVKLAKKQGMNALAITDHGNLFGAIEFFDACKSEGVNPILGYEAYVAPAHRSDRVTRGGVGGEASYHLTMLAMNRTGFQNICRLASHAYLEGFYYKPRIDKELLEQFHEGIIVLSGCAAGEMSTLLMGGRLDEAQKLAEWFAKLLGDRFYLEIQDNGLAIQKECAAGTIEIAQRVGLPLVATCDTHYLCADDAYAHEVLLCINTGKTIRDPKRMQYGSSEFFLKPPAEMYKAFPGHADAVKRSQEIADRVAIDLDFKQRHFPVFRPPESKTDVEYLAELCEIGLKRRYGDEITREIRDRLELELGVVKRLGFASYFLIVWDFVNFAGSVNIPCGARGSACGALVSYLLGFSNVCPLKYDLLFERFLDPSRVEAPDIDIDFCQHRREEVIEYVKRKYGEKNVCQIITFGTMAAKAVLRDVGRALEIPLDRVNKLAGLVPKKLNITLKESLEESQELKKEYDTDPDVRKWIDVAMRLEGLARNPGTHAAGVVIGDKPLAEIIPLQKNGDIVTTQWEMGILEKVGMLKFDFLGLRNLTILQAAVEVIEKSRGTPIDLLALPLDDPKTFTLLQRGETKGVFQLESEGIRNLLIRLRPDSFFDIIAVAALYRPGPLGGGMVDKYINVKHGREKAEYAHPVMKDVLEETYGVMVYQEQVMRILNRLGDIELADAYKCIKAISKKKLEIIAKYKEKFVTGAQAKGLAGPRAEEIFALIEHFAGYGFNKSHSTAYALIAYQTAYLKAHYPAEFMAALMSSETDKTDLLVEHIEDCKRMGLEVKPPDVNQGQVGFAVNGREIRFGLVAIKGAGEKAIEAVVAEREKSGRFTDLFDLCERLDAKVFGKACLEALIKAGALDSFGLNRATLTSAIPKAMQAAASVREARDAGQGLLFGGGDDGGEKAPPPKLPEIPEWPDQQKLQFEKETLGIYLSSHPLAERDRTLRIYRTHQISDIANLPGRAEVILGGMISAVRHQTHRQGKYENQRYARFQFEDLTGSIGAVMFAEAFSEFSGKVTDERICFIRAEVDRSREEPGLIVNEVIDPEFAPKVLAGRLVVRLDGQRHNDHTVTSLARVLKSRPGPSQVGIEVTTSTGLVTTLMVSGDYNVVCDEDLARQIEEVVGQGRVRFGRPPRQASGGGGGGNGHGPKRGGFKKNGKG